MKIKKNLLFAMSLIALTACDSDLVDNIYHGTSIEEEEYLQTENGVIYTYDKHEADCILTDEQIVFVTTQRIHESMPEFTFTRIVGGYFENYLIYAFPFAVEVTIIIEDDNGNLIQIISGLSQSENFINSDLAFDDFNFDGYLDMRLKRWQDGAGGLLANEYFWLWNTDERQFILNEQLVEIGHAAGLNVNNNTQRITVRQRNGALSNHYFYEYIYGSFELVAHEYKSREYNESGASYVMVTHTELRTGVVTVMTY